MEFYESNEVVTRKNHQCFLCYENIPKGTKCLYENGRYDGEWFSRHSHDECGDLWMKFNDSSDEDWIMLDSVDNKNFNFNKHKQFIKEKYKIKEIHQKEGE